jgi:hypothetical protein
MLELLKLSFEFYLKRQEISNKITEAFIELNDSLEVQEEEDATYN